MALTRQENEQHVDILLLHMLRAQEVSNESELNLERRKALTVCRVQKLLHQN